MSLTFALGLRIVAATPDTNPDNSNAVQTETSLSRWLTLDSLSFSSRYRNSTTTAGLRFFDSYQQKTLVAGKFKFDRDGKYGIGFRASSGRYINWSYATYGGLNSTEAVANNLRATPFRAQYNIYVLHLEGVPFNPVYSRGWEFYPRELYISASPVKQVTFQFGGLGMEHGAGTEITTFDDDAYMSGERVRVNDSKHLYFDEISATFGYFGDIAVPNFFSRGDRLAQNNYRQVMFQKKFGKRVVSSLSYDWLSGIDTLREAANVGVGESRALDNLRVELYQRLNRGVLLAASFPSASGWSISGRKNLFHKHWGVEGGYADIDRYDGVYSGNAIAVVTGFSLNGDSYQIGKRIFGRISYKPSEYFEFFSFYTHQLDAPKDLLYFTLNKQTWNVGAAINFESMLQKSGLLK